MSVKRSLVAALPEGTYRSLKFLRAHKRLPRRTPRTFSEKVHWRIRNDRRPLLAWTGDKLAMKEHAAACAGLHVARTLWTGTDLNDLVDVALPDQWVLKPNCSSGVVHFGSGPVTVAVAAALVERTESWLDAADVTHRREWIYSQARRTYLVEERIGAGSAPTDFKVFVFDGEPRFVRVDTDRFGHHCRAVYDTEWQPIPVRYGPAFPAAPPVPRPARLDEMLRVAAELGQEFDFIRIDLYEVDGQVWFGEFTPYSDSGLAAIEPRSYERLWGSWWQLPKHEAVRT